MLTAIAVVLIGGAGCFLLLFALLHWDYSLRQAHAVELESRYGAEQVLRAREKYRLLRQIGAPECPDGSYSPNQMALWRQYKDLDEFDKTVTAWEINQIVETRGYS